MPDPAFLYGTAKLQAPTDLGLYFREYELWLNDKCETNNVAYIAFEAPVLPRFTNINTLRQLYALCGITELIANKRGIKCREAQISKIRKFICHDGGADKDAVWKMIRLYGYQPSTLDESDAIALRLYVVGRERVALLKDFRGLELGPLSTAADKSGTVL
jgi:Holliday junction resolvasome RuvABC endonuclease subunit